MDFELNGMSSRAHKLFSELESQGAAYLETLYTERKSEELFLDYKRVTTASSARSLSNSDRDNLKKALSGFSNSEGGVILWGLETEKNEGGERLKFPEGFSDSENFVSLIEDAISGCTVPPVPGVRSIRIPQIGDSSKGFVATLVPASLIAPHQTTDDARAYFMRTGSSFQRVPHGVLAGMFGRRPNATLSMNCRVTRYATSRGEPGSISVTFELSLANSSSVVASDAYISWSAKELGTDYSELRSRIDDVPLWHLNQPNVKHGSALAAVSHRLAPYSKYTVLSIEMKLYGEIVNGIDIDIFYGCEGSTPQFTHLNVSKDELVVLVEELKLLDATVSEFDPEKSLEKHAKCLELGRRILGSPKP